MYRPTDAAAQTAAAGTPLLLPSRGGGAAPPSSPPPSASASPAHRRHRRSARERVRIPSSLRRVAGGGSAPKPPEAPECQPPSRRAARLSPAMRCRTTTGGARGGARAGCGWRRRQRKIHGSQLTQPRAAGAAHGRRGRPLCRTSAIAHHQNSRGNTPPRPQRAAHHGLAP